MASAAVEPEAIDHSLLDPRWVTDTIVIKVDTHEFGRSHKFHLVAEIGYLSRIQPKYDLKEGVAITTTDEELALRQGNCCEVNIWTLNQLSQVSVLQAFFKSLDDEALSGSKLVSQKIPR